MFPFESSRSGPSNEVYHDRYNLCKVLSVVTVLLLLVSLFRPIGQLRDAFRVKGEVGVNQSETSYWYLVPAVSIRVLNVFVLGISVVVGISAICSRNMEGWVLLLLCILSIGDICGAVVWAVMLYQSYGVVELSV